MVQFLEYKFQGVLENSEITQHPALIQYSPPDSYPDLVIVTMKILTFPMVILKKMRSGKPLFNPGCIHIIPHLQKIYSIDTISS
jgi:hypothetical protein